jgi:Eukaryotic aspartyl protease
MKAPTASAILSVAALSSCAFAAVSMNIVKNRDATPKIRRRNLLPRAPVTVSLQNNETGGDYVVTAKVGTPAQTVTFLIDTGSSDVWMLAASSDLCTSPELQTQTGGCSSTCKFFLYPTLERFHLLILALVDQTKSSTYNLTDQGAFSITYADQTGANGDYITDVFSIGGVTIKGLEMGLAYNSSSATGVMGIGYDVNEASDDTAQGNQPFVYPNFIDTMVNQGLITTKAYSLYLDDLEASTGSIIFGGYDTDKYQGSLFQLPIVPDSLNNGSNIYAEFGVAMTGLSISQSGSTKTISNSSYDQDCILDSGTALVYLPEDLTADIVTFLGGVDDTQGSGNIYVNCNLRNTITTINFGFGGSGGTTIQVPSSELIFDLTGIFQVPTGSLPTLPFTSVCALGIQSQQSPPYILGDTFLRSAYIVYDLKNNLIGIAQTNFNAGKSNIVEFQAGSTTIPTASGAATSAVVGVTHTKNAASSTIPEFDVRRLFVLGISAGFAVLGGLLLV